MDNEIIMLINNISQNIHDRLAVLNHDKVNQLTQLITEEKELGKKELLIKEKKQLFDDFIQQVIDYIKENLTEQQMKEIFTVLLNWYDDERKLYDDKYRSFAIESDTLYYLLHGLTSAISDKDFVSNISEAYYREVLYSNKFDRLMDTDHYFFSANNFYKPLLILSCCKDESLKKRLVQQEIKNNDFMKQFSNSPLFDDNILMEAVKDFFENHRNETESWNFYNELLRNESIPLNSKMKITNLYRMNFPEFYDLEKAYIYPFLVQDYDSAIRCILDNNLHDIALNTFLIQCKIKGEDLIKLYNDERLINRLSPNIFMNEYIDGDTQYNILFHTLLKKYALDHDIMDKALLHANDDLIYSVLSHTDSLSYILQNQKFINEFIEKYFRFNHHKANTNAKILEVFKDVLTPQQMNVLFQPGCMPNDIYLPYYLNDKYCYKIFNVYHPEYNPNGVRDKVVDMQRVQSLIHRLYNDNNFLFKTFLPEIISDDIFQFDYKFISLISRYIELQENISQKINEGDSRLAKIGVETEFLKDLKSDPVKYQQWMAKAGYSMDHTAQGKPVDSRICGKTFIQMLKVINDIDPDYIIPYVSTFNKITTTDFWYDVFNDIHVKKEPASLFEQFVINVCQGLDLDTITDDQWKIITKVILHDISSSTKNYYISVDMNSLQDVDTYDERRRKKLDDLFTEALNNKETEQAINIFLNKYYDMDINRAREIVETYGIDLDNVKDNQYRKSIDLIEKIKYVLSIENLQELRNLYQNEIELSLEDTIIFNDSLTKIYGHAFSNSLTSFHDMIKIDNEQMKFPSSVRVYEVPDDFILLVHSTAAYGELQLIENNYKTSWNENDRTRNHGICCSVIANDYFGTAEINDVLLGFNSLSEASLLKSAPYDLFTSNDDVDITAAKKSRFFSPRNIINNTRHTHNEQSIERRELRSELRDKGITNLQPNYVVVYSDMDEKLRNKAIKCAEDFDIPIVYVDKERIVQNESDKIDAMIDQFYKTQDVSKRIDIFSDIYLKHENNRCGLLHDKEELQAKFSTNRIEKLIDNIVNQIIEDKNNTRNYQKYCDCVLKLVEILQREEDKFITCYDMGSHIAFNDIDVNQYIVKMYGEMDNQLNQARDPKLTKIAATTQLNDRLVSQELHQVEVSTIENEILNFNNSEFYCGETKNHGLDHIERVTVLASMLGKREFPDSRHAQDLLRLSAELHDSGRENDERDYNHAERGALLASKVLQDKLNNGEISQNDLHTIQFAIEYHEYDHLRDDHEEKLQELAEKYQISDTDFEYAKKIAQCLKDADALDRVRFHNKKATLDERRLITDTSHELIATAKELLQEYKDYEKNQFVIQIFEKCKEQEEKREEFKQRKLKYKMKSKFEQVVNHLMNMVNNGIMRNSDSIEGDINEIRRR